MNLLTSQELRTMAKSQLKSHLGPAILIMFIAWLAVLGIPLGIFWCGVFFSGVQINRDAYYLAGTLISFVLMGPFSFGVAHFYLNCAQSQEAHIKDLFKGLGQSARCFFAHLIMGIFVTLWSLLLVIPGVMAAISYSQTYYILNEYSELSFLEAITLSRVLMHGYKLEYLLLSLTFIGWWILIVVTLGFAIVFIGPYMEATYANFYINLKTVHNDAIERFMEQRMH